MAYEFKLPDIGEGIHEGEILQWLVKPGDSIQEDQPIVEIMTDKVTAEIPSPVSGILQETRGKAGEIVRVGSVIAVFGDAGENKQAASASAKAAEPTQALAESIPTSISTAEKPVNGNGKTLVAPMQERPDNSSSKVLAAPATRKLARELGVPLSEVTGSGPRGRVTQTDLRQFQGGGSSSAKKPTAILGANDFSSQGERRVPFGGLRRKIAEHLVKSKQTAPHFSYVEEADMTKLVAMRDDLLPLAEAEGIKLSYLPFIIKAVISGLRKYPMLNSQLDETTQEQVFKNDYHIGVAVATDQGLVVPVIKYADQKNLFALANEIKFLAEKARNGKLTLDELKGGTFTLTSIGSIGGLFSVPIINYPEVAIMGINKIEKRPVVRHIEGQDQIVIREMTHLSISCDHRAVDGAEAALFVKEMIQYLENPSRLIATL